MSVLGKRIDFYFLLLLALIGLWWGLAGGIRTPASEIDALERTSDPEVWARALRNTDRAVRSYARGHIMEACSPEALAEIALDGYRAVCAVHPRYRQIDACLGLAHFSSLWPRLRVPRPPRRASACRQS